MKVNKGTCAFLLGLSFALYGCAKDSLLPDVGETDRPYVLHLPAHFPQLEDMPDNPLTEAGVQLGRHLFHEPLLSGNMQVSCATCHHQGQAFSDGLVLSNTGVSGKALERHTPVLFNLAWADQGLFWDGGAKNLESQAFAPLVHPDEMGIFFPEMVARLVADTGYRRLFRLAFDEMPTAAGVAKALAQFQRTLVSATAPYDRWRSGESADALGPREIRGLQLVQQHCGNCHAGELFTDNQFHNNGIDADFSDDGNEEILLGRYRVSRETHDVGAFKTPSLRNVMVSAPYMHDGRFADIDAVLAHYRNGIHDSPYTARKLYTQGGNPGIVLGEQDVEDIKAFLHTLTDQAFLQNEKYTKPNKI